jgi:hypothetical protein
MSDFSHAKGPPMMKWMMHSHNADLPSLNLGFGSSATWKKIATV